MALPLKTTMPKEPRWMTRKDVADELSKHGYIISWATLATYAAKGKGPPMMKFGQRVMYDADRALAWAKARLKPPPLKL